jgi:hypothetical protein
MSAVELDEMTGWVDDLRPTRAIDETPAGRLAGIDEGTWWTYREILGVLSRAAQVDTEAQTACDVEMSCLRDTMLDLHQRATEAFDALFARTWGW